MKKMIALVMALVMALSLTTMAWGATEDPCASNPCAHLAAIGTAHYDTLADAIAAVPTDGTQTTIKLLDSFTVSNYIIDGSASYAFKIGESQNVILDMNGKTITVSDPVSKTDNGFIYTFGTLEVVGNGAITLTATVDKGWGGSSSIFHNRGGVLTIENGTFTHNGGTDMAFVVDNSGNYYGDATTYINGGTLTSSYIGIRNRMEQNSHGASGTAYLYVTDGAITGQYSVWGQAATKSDTSPSNGVVEVSGGALNGTLLVAHGTGTESQIVISGDAVVEDIECEASDLSITGGTVTGTLTPVDESGNTVTSADIVSGGTFNTDVSEYVVDGMQLLANGTVVTTPAAGATDPVLYVADNSAAGWATYYIATGADLDDLKQGADENCLPCYLIDGEYFVEAKEAAATYKLVYGAKTVFLAPVAEKLVKYEDTASVLTVVDAEDAECGDYYVTNLDEDDVYYISYNKKGEVDGIWVKAKNGSEQILVNGKIMDAEDASSDVTFMFHKFKGYDVVNGEYTTVKCENCPKVAKLYANATAATVGKKDAVKIDTLGWITFADYMDFGANAPVVTDKVQSAETFDAGIAMYVGMSVMAAAGSAVVLKKRED